MTPDELRELISNRMIGAGISAAELARRSDVSYRSIHEWMAGQSLAQSAAFLTALEVLGVHLRVCGNPPNRVSRQLPKRLGSDRAET